jgi:hypothetical protein
MAPYFEIREEWADPLSGRWGYFKEMKMPDGYLSGELLCHAFDLAQLDRENPEIAAQARAHGSKIYLDRCGAGQPTPDWWRWTKEYRP